jgi:hypothetical protein
MEANPFSAQAQKAPMSLLRCFLLLLFFSNNRLYWSKQLREGPCSPWFHARDHVREARMPWVLFAPKVLPNSVDALPYESIDDILGHAMGTFGNFAVFRRDLDGRTRRLPFSPQNGAWNGVQN